MNKFTWLALASSLFCSQAVMAAEPFHFVIFADRDSAETAVNFRKTMLKKRPFSLMGDQLKVTVHVLPDRAIDCKPGALGIMRLPACNWQSLSMLANTKGAHRTLVITDKLIKSGAGGGPVAAVSKDIALDQGFHELLHGLGFNDEYTYPLDEAKIFCGLSLYSIPNSARFKSQNPYPSDDAAKKTHNRDYAWSGQVAGSTRITAGNILGTRHGDYFPHEPALYPSGDCQEIIESWTPFPGTIMKKEHGNIPPLYEDWITRSMGSIRGEPIKLRQEPTKDCLGKLTSDDIYQDPILTQIGDRIKQKLSEFLPKTTAEIPHGLLDLYPEVRNALAELKKASPACYARLVSSETPSGDLRLSKEPLIPLSENQVGIRFMQAREFLDKIARFGTFPHPACFEAKIPMNLSKAAYQATLDLDRPFPGKLSCMFQYRFIESRAENKTCFNEPEADRVSAGKARRLLGDAYDVYLKALDSRHPYGKNFDCRNLIPAPSAPAGSNAESASSAR